MAWPLVPYVNVELGKRSRREARSDLSNCTPLLTDYKLDSIIVIIIGLINIVI